jgi:hypothetical protein
VGDVGGERRGRAAVIDYHERVFGLFESVRIEVEELLSAGDDWWSSLASTPFPGAAKRR